MQFPKYLRFSAITIVCSLFLAACPVSTSFPLANSDEAISQDDLVGNWRCNDKDAEFIEVKISSTTKENIFKAEIIEKGSMYMAEVVDFKCWVYTFENHPFLIAQELDSTGVASERYYLYKLEKKGADLVLYDVSLKVKGTDAITSVEAFQEELRGSMKMADWYTLPRQFYKK